MIESATGDILAADVEALVNPVNCVGVMGAGLAAQVKRAYPETFAAYRRACARRILTPGRTLVVETDLWCPSWIVNVATKQHWRYPSCLDWVRSGIDAIVADVDRLGIQSIAIPRIGCGLGGLDWADVRPIIDRRFGPRTDVRVLVYDAPSQQGCNAP